MSRLGRAVVAEAVGTAFLLAGVVGSGIMAERLSDDVGVQLLENSIATGGLLVALILALGSASGAHFNPAVTLADRAFGGIDTTTAAAYIAAQLVGGIGGVIAANAMFDLDLVEWSTARPLGRAPGVRRGSGHPRVAARHLRRRAVRPGRAGLFAVGGYIAAAYWFTSSTSFANPAVTVARTFSDTFAGIEPGSAPRSSWPSSSPPGSRSG